MKKDLPHTYSVIKWWWGQAKILNWSSVPQQERLFSSDQHANKPIRFSFGANQPIKLFVPVSYFMLGSCMAGRWLMGQRGLCVCVCMDLCVCGLCLCVCVRAVGCLNITDNLRCVWRRRGGKGMVGADISWKWLQVTTYWQLSLELRTCRRIMFIATSHFLWLD